MVGARILPAFPVRPGCPEWKGDHGETLAEALADALGAYSFPVESDRGAVRQAVQAGEYVGVTLLSPRRGWVAVWHPTMAAALGSIGLEACTVAMLHHQLHSLVLAGQLEASARTRDVPGMGTAWHYVLRLPT